MSVVVVGLNHRTVPLEVLERMTVNDARLPKALYDLRTRPNLSEAVVLSTCNRTEIYAVAEKYHGAIDDIRTFLTDLSGLNIEDFSDHVYAYHDDFAVAHLFKVASGLDSAVLGESEILGQVKDAFAAASDVKSTGALTHRLFTSAFGVGKRVRRETALGEGAVSVSYAAIALAKKIFGRLDGLNVLILGAGEMAKLTASHLQAQGVKQLTIASRTFETAEALASRLNGRAAPWTSIGHALAAADIVVTATGSREPVLTRAGVEEAMRPRRSRPLFVIDIAVPRDVEASVGTLDQVFLYNIDDLQSIVKENMARRTSEVDRAELIVREEVDRFKTWMHSRELVPTVVALRQRFEAIRRAELQRLEPRLASMPPEARARVDEITHLLVEKLLLTPTEQLKAAEDEAQAVADADALNRLFNLTAPKRDSGNS